MQADRNLAVLMESIGFQLGTLRWVDRFAVGRNNGGVYVRFFQTNATYSIIAVYEQDFWKLPPEIRKVAEEQGQTLRPKRAANTERAEAEAEGKMIECDPMQICRFQFSPGKENEQWRFAGIYRIVKRKEQPKQEQTNGKVVGELPVEPQFKTLAEALDWGVAAGAYQNREQAKVAMEGLKMKVDTPSLRNAWIKMVGDVVAAKPKVAA